MIRFGLILIAAAVTMDVMIAESAAVKGLPEQPPAVDRVFLVGLLAAFCLLCLFSLYKAKRC